MTSKANLAWGLLDSLKKNNISNIQSVSFYGLSFMPKRIKINGETNKKIWSSTCKTNKHIFPKSHKKPMLTSQFHKST